MLQVLEGQVGRLSCVLGQLHFRTRFVGLTRHGFELTLLFQHRVVLGERRRRLCDNILGQLVAFVIALVGYFGG